VIIKQCYASGKNGGDTLIRVMAIMIICRSFIFIYTCSWLLIRNVHTCHVVCE